MQFGVCPRVPVQAVCFCGCVCPLFSHKTARYFVMNGTHVLRKQQGNLVSVWWSNWGVSSLEMAQSDRLRGILGQWERCLGSFSLSLCVTVGGCMHYYTRFLWSQEERTLRCFSPACLYFTQCESPSVLPAVSTPADFTLTAYLLCILTRGKGNG